MLEFWNAGQGRFPNSEILKIYWILFQCGIWGYPLCLMDKMKYPRFIYQRLCLPSLPLLSQQKTYLHILTSLYVNILNWISTSHNSVNKTGCSQHTLNITELELLSSFTLATNLQTAAAVTEYLLFVSLFVCLFNISLVNYNLKSRFYSHLKHEQIDSERLRIFLSHKMVSEEKEFEPRPVWFLCHAF